MSLRIVAKATGTAALLVAPFLLPLWLDAVLPGTLPWQRVFLNMLPLFLIALMALGATRRPILSLVLLLGFVKALFFVNGVKVAELREPVVFNDFLLLPQVITGFDLLGSYVDTAPLVLAIGVFIGLCSIGWKWEKPIFGWRPALIVLLLSVFSFTSLDSPEQPLGSLYHSSLIVPMDWEARENVKRNGLIATLVRSSSNILYDLPEVDPLTVHRPDFLPSDDSWTSTEGLDNPDIIVVLSESFFDPAVLREIEPCDYLKRWCELKTEGAAGWLDVPTYGGNTTRSEFELLTGIPFATFGGMDYPYVSVVNRPMFSIPWHLKSIGYRTTAIHTHTRTFWRRNAAFPRLGFDRFISIKDMGTVDWLGFWTRDSFLTDQIFNVLEQPDPDHPEFILAISMENHGPWNANRRSRLPEAVSDITVPAAADAIPAKPLQQFLFHAENALTELERLWSYTQQRPRKTLLVFFGDHLPGLNDSFNALGFDDGLAAFQQPTPYLVLSNFPLRNAPPQRLPIHQLVIQALHAAGVPLGKHYGNLQNTYVHDRSLLDVDSAQALDEYLNQLQIGLLRVPVP
jgi:hypothetical protein